MSLAVQTGWHFNPDPNSSVTTEIVGHLHLNFQKLLNKVENSQNMKDHVIAVIFLNRDYLLPPCSFTSRPFLSFEHYEKAQLQQFVMQTESCFTGLQNEFVVGGVVQPWFNE